MTMSVALTNRCAEGLKTVWGNVQAAAERWYDRSSSLCIHYIQRLGIQPLAAIHQDSSQYHPAQRDYLQNFPYPRLKHPAR